MYSLLKAGTYQELMERNSDFAEFLQTYSTNPENVNDRPGES